MSPRPLVSVVTGTYDRHELLLSLIENIREQTYRPLEHVIVTDGPDPELRRKVDAIRQDDDVPIIWCELGRQWSHFLGDSISAAPLKVAQFLAHGDYHCWAADDERFTPDHIESLIDIIEETGVDFAYSQSRCYWPHDPDGGVILGTNPPRHGQITQATHKVELLKHRMFELHVGAATDWDQIKHWMAAPNVRWAFLRRVTHSHKIDKVLLGLLCAGLLLRII